jgi:hypothetical protein
MLWFLMSEALAQPKNALVNPFEEKYTKWP